MKKTFAFFVAVVVIATFSTCVFAAKNYNDSDSPFNFDHLLPDYDSATTLIFGYNLTGMIKDGFWFAELDNSSLEGILSTTKFNGVPTFLFDLYNSNSNNTTTSYILPAALTTESHKKLNVVSIGNNKAIVPLHSFSNPLKNALGSTIGYTCENNLQLVRGNKAYSFMALYINSNNVVYPIIVAIGSELNWDNEWPKNNQELTSILNEVLKTQNNYTYYITPIIDSGLDSGGSNSRSLSSSGRKLRYTFSATSTIGGTISDIGNKLFQPENIHQTYTITSDKGYTIYYVEIDGKIVSNSINCGDNLTLTFDDIYGNRSIHAVFRKKQSMS